MSKILGVLLLILAMVVAVTAYSSAQVNNPGTMAIVNTSDSLLTMRACTGTGNKDGAIYVDMTGAGELKFDFRKGLADYGDLGFQPNSEYTWECAFEVHNKTNETLDVWIENANFPYVDVGAVAQCPDNWWCGIGDKYFVAGGANTENVVTLAPDFSFPVSVSFKIPAGVSEVTVSSSLRVHAAAQ